MKGFTLLETAVVLAIMSILTGLILTSWPRTRQQQALLLATEQIQTLIRTAQQKALNEDRAEACLATVEDTPESRRLCSDVGVAIKGNTIVMFADTINPSENKYDDTPDSPHDFLIEQQTLALGVTGPSGWQSFIFEATPPTINMFTSNQRLTLRIGNVSKDITVKTYGQVE